MNKTNLAVVEKIVAEGYPGYNESHAFIGNLKEKHLPSTGPVELGDIQNVLEHFAKEFHLRNNDECKSLKQTLTGMEGAKEGRVRLSTFYSKALFTHWSFREKKSFLRALGALDESDPDQPQVIISNYIMGRHNCLQASGLYAVCCQNECEDLLTKLETTFGAPEATPERIAQVVSAMASDTVPAPRNIS